VVLDAAQIEKDRLPRAANRRGQIERLAVGGGAAVVANARFRSRGPIIELVEDERLGSAPLRIERHLPGACHLPIRFQFGEIRGGVGMAGPARVAEDHKVAFTRRKLQRHDRACGFLAPLGQVADLSGDRVPQLRLPAVDTELNLRSDRHG